MKLRIEKLGKLSRENPPTRAEHPTRTPANRTRPPSSNENLNRRVGIANIWPVMDGTGGTSGGLSRYVYKEFGKKSVRVVFPPGTQDVRGIRTKEKASGLKFYEPNRYAGLHEADFESARRTLRFFVKKKEYDIGESSALALYATLQMMNYGVGEKFIVGTRRWN